MRSRLKKLHLLMLEEKHLSMNVIFTIRSKNIIVMANGLNLMKIFSCQMYCHSVKQYFENVEALEGRPYITNRTLKSLLSDVDKELENVNLNRGDVYVNHKLAQINLQKAQLLADDDKQVQKYQKVIDDIQEVIDRNKEEQRKIDQEKLAIKMMKHKARQAQRNLDIFAMRVMVGMSMVSNKSYSPPKCPSCMNDTTYNEILKVWNYETPDDFAIFSELYYQMFGEDFDIPYTTESTTCAFFPYD